VSTSERGTSYAIKATTVNAKALAVGEGARAEVNENERQVRGTEHVAPKIFISYASQDKVAAESIAFSLRSRGYEVFLDRDKLPPGISYDLQIETAVQGSDFLVFLISPDSVAGGRYTLTELSFARRRWPTPTGRVLPVLIRATEFDQIPGYLKAVTILHPEGNVAAETSAAVDKMR
jgi:hypothetical protein